MDKTFHLTCALVTASSESRFTIAIEASHSVGAVSIVTTLSQVYFTLIHI